MTKVHSSTRLIGHLSATIAAAVVMSVLASSAAYAQSATTAFQRAQAREQAARKAPSPTPVTLRSIATSYEVIVRRHPTSALCDNALWQAAGLLQLSYERSGVPRDREGAVKMLQWLKREYPGSSYSRQVDARVATLAPRRPPVTVVAPVKERSTPAPPAPAPPAKAPALPPKGAAVATASFETAPSVRTAPLAPLPVVFREYSIALKDTSYAALPRGERLTIELSAEVAPTVDRSGDQMSLTLPGVGVSTAVVEATSKLRGTLVRGMRINPAADGLNLKLDLAGSARYSTFPLYDPYRVVIDFDADDNASVRPPAAAPLAAAPVGSKPSARAAAATPEKALPPPASIARPAPEAPKPAEFSSTPMPPASTRDGGYSLARQLGLGVSRIVIDPGHGGHDPGAQANGVSEAELVLDVAKRLEALLHDQPGFEVVLTRRTNDFIPLQERTAIANREGADLFLSIHANSSPQKDTRGVETYFLNFASNPQAEAVAARENASSVQAMGVLPQIVKAIALNNKLTESRELATLVQGSLMRRLAVQNKAVRDLGVKQAPFVVLIGAQMPSVLAEISFLTNKTEAGLLKQDAYRQRIAQALCDSVLKYQSSLKKVGTVASVIEAR
ncbi:MAG: N-acetylmuramoyl-L-alanine amidase [Acidobacteriota bacterium]